ncbi:hypothetical protein [Pseudomonas atacamensis]|uniref:Uncharacterized protein n=1 Tax=Pseudomonas iranensis TaxID=2745503 RepID=A0AAU7F469_9PSED
MIAEQWIRITEYTHSHISGKANITAVEPSRLIATDRADSARDLSDSNWLKIAIDLERTQTFTVMT